jgi:GTP cyclohydrolase I
MKVENIENVKKTKCEICKKLYWRITNTHLWKTHQITKDEYKEQYPNSVFEDPIISKWRQNLKRDKSYEEIYGEENGKEQKELRKFSTTKQMTDQNQINIRKEKCGYSPTDEQKKINSDKHLIHGANTYRKRAFQYYGEECARCGSENNLVVHHIDGNNAKSELGNHNINNLMVLCRKCHSKFYNEEKENKLLFTGTRTLEKGAQQMLKGLKQLYGLDLTDVNLKDTPKRIARAWVEIFQGINNKKKVKNILSTAFPSTYDGMIIIDNIISFSMCPHHFLPVEYRVSIGYISKNKMLGLSKLPRLVQLLAKKPALQEDYTEEITTTLMNELEAEGAIVVVHGRHMCMRMRGVKAVSSDTITSSIKGAFNKPEVKAEFNALSKGNSWE